MHDFVILGSIRTLENPSTRTHNNSATNKWTSCEDSASAWDRRE